MDNNLVADYTTWERGKDYPEYMDEVALSTISKGYLLPGETPKKAYRRVAHAVAMRLNRPDLENKFFKYIWNAGLDWLALYSQTQGQTEDSRLAALVSILQIQSEVLALQTQNSCDSPLTEVGLVSHFHVSEDVVNTSQEMVNLKA